MPRGTKTKKETVEKIIKDKIENPTKTIYKIAQETGLSKSTVGDIIKENEEMWKKSSYKQELVDKNIQIIQKASSILLKNLNLYAEGKRKIKTIYELERVAEIMNKSINQNNLLDGDDTSENIEIKIKLPKI